MKKSVINKDPKELAASLGLNPHNAIEWEVRYSVANKIIETAKKRRLSVTEMAKLAGTSQTRIIKILKGDTFGISLDVLFKVLGSTGQIVKLSYRRVA